MKRLFMAFSACLIALLTSMIFTSCNVKQDFEKEIHEKDSLLVVKLITNAINPTFNSIEEIDTYKRNVIENKREDSVFLSIPESVIPNVVSVLKKNGDKVTKKSLVDEFSSNKRIYLNLPEDRHGEHVPIPDVPNVKVVDTVINGKEMQIMESATNNSKITITRPLED